MPQPHLIQLLSDEHLGLAMSCAGDPNVHTPNMDRLATEGVHFRRAYANCPVCVPSRGTIFSGLHAHAGPVPGFFDIWKVNAPSLATELTRAGYHTAYFGKWHLAHVQDQVPRSVRDNPARFPGKGVRIPEDRRAGFVDWFGYEVIHKNFRNYVFKNHDADPTPLDGFNTDVLTDLVVDYLQNYQSDQPLCLVLSVEPPHFPLEAPDVFLRHDPRSLQLRPNCRDNADRREAIAKYYAMIENLDWNLGRLMDTLESLPAFAGERTCLSYISDHGEFMGSHDMFCRKEYPYEEGVRIPAMFRWPNHIPASGSVDGLFSLVDYAPTLIGLAGQEPPAWMQGHDWSPRLRGEREKAGPARVLLEMTDSPRWTPGYLNWRGYVDHRCKYAFYENGREELFDLDADPYEQHNLATEQPERVAECRQTLLKMLRETREPFFDVLIEHGVPVNQPVHYLPPPHPDMGFPGDWRGTDAMPGAYFEKP